jgi:hypothetical protein
MNLHELWAELTEGRIPSTARVWREGMECWLPARDTPETAIVLLDGITPEPSTVALDNARLSSVPPPRLEPPPKRDLGWVAAGAAVGLASFLVALLAAPPPPALAAARSGLADVATSLAARAVAEAPVLEAQPAAAARPAHVSHPRERGQHRLR